MGQEEREQFVRVFHESMRGAAQRGLVANPLGKPFLGWDELSAEAREGRRMMVDWILERYDVARK